MNKVVQLSYARQQKYLETIWKAGVESVCGEEAMHNALDKSRHFYPSHLIAIGKAAPQMAKSVLNRFDYVIPTIIVTKYGHSIYELPERPAVKIIESGHPIPDKNSLLAGLELVKFLHSLPGDAVLAVLVSGGASALAEVLTRETSLEELQSFNQEMLADGFDIGTINERRKKFSLIKGGLLLKEFRGSEARVFGLSDVPENDLSIIGSGVGCLSLCKIGSQQSHIVGSNAIARKASAKKAHSLGAEIQLNEESLYGDIKDVADRILQSLLSGPPGVYIYGGEPTLHLPKNPGDGGRNQALALELARRFSAEKRLSALVGGTDGNDGPGHAAGGFVTSDCWDRIPGGAQAIQHANSGKWLQQSGGIFVTGPSGTNVMDLVIAEKG